MRFPGGAVPGDNRAWCGRRWLARGERLGNQWPRGLSKRASPCRGQLGEEVQWGPGGCGLGLEGAGQGSDLRCRSLWASLFCLLSVLGLLWLGAVGSMASWDF